MIEGYQRVLKEVEVAVKEMRFALTEDTEYEAVFTNEKGWIISLEGERYCAPAFNLMVAVGQEEKRFAVYLLMTVFGEDIKPSLVNSLAFVKEYKDRLFVSPAPYEAEYDKLNNVYETW